MNCLIPRNVNLSKVTQNEIQEAFGGFFQQNPQVLIQVFAKSKVASVLPKSTIEERKQMSLALRKLGNEDLDWTDGIVSSRKNKDYSSVFFLLTNDDLS